MQIYFYVLTYNHLSFFVIDLIINNFPTDLIQSFYTTKIPNTKYIDLDGSFDLAEDIVTGGFEIIDGYMHINSNPGFGIDII
mgnify:CR=1 FL=1